MRSSATSHALGFAETAYVSLTAVIADRAMKASGVELLGLEPCGNERILLRFRSSDTASMEAAMASVETASEELGCPSCSTVLSAPHESISSLNQGVFTLNPIYGGREEWLPDDYTKRTMTKSHTNESLGVLETQGLTASLEACDVMLKTADVRLRGKEKIGAAYVAIMIAGDVAAVTAAIEAGQAAAKSLGKVIAAHVIARPHEDLIALLP